MRSNAKTSPPHVVTDCTSQWSPTHTHPPHHTHSHTLTHTQTRRSLAQLITSQVAVEIMVERAKTLDQFVRQYLAPLGVYFPFPHHCSKLDSYLRRSEEFTAANVTGSVLAPALNNDKFWDEWKQVKVTDICMLPTHFVCIPVMAKINCRQ